MSDADPADRPHTQVPVPDGGDAACWLSEVCPDCGALNESPTGPCWRCGAVRGEERSDTDGAGAASYGPTP